MLNYEELKSFVGITLLGDSERAPISEEDAATAIAEWTNEGVELPHGITASAFASEWNDQLALLQSRRPYASKQQEIKGDKTMTREEQLSDIATRINDLVTDYGRRKDIAIIYSKLNKKNLDKFSTWDRERFTLIAGEECFFVYEINMRTVKSNLLYVVAVTGDSLLTAAEELMDLVAKKF